MIRVAILGASGYSALELIRILLRHPEVEITALTTRKTESPSIGEVHPSLAGRLHLKLENLSADVIANRAECRLSAQRCGRISEMVRPRTRRSGPTAKPFMDCRRFIASESSVPNWS